MTSQHYLAAERNRLSFDMLNMIMWLDGANGTVSDYFESQKWHCSQAEFATPCGWKL
jgi:hypothetical protein